MEMAPTEELFGDPRHPYTRSLLSAIPIPKPAIERQRRPIVFDYETQKPSPDAVLMEVSPRHFVLS